MQCCRTTFWPVWRHLDSNPYNRVLRLESGPPDSMAQPFESRELVAWMQTVLCRAHHRNEGASQHSRSDVSHFGRWSFHRDDRCLTLSAGLVIALSHAEYRLLTTFGQMPRRLFSRDERMVRKLKPRLAARCITCGGRPTRSLWLGWTWPRFWKAWWMTSATAVMAFGSVVSPPLCWHSSRHLGTASTTWWPRPFGTGRRMLCCETVLIRSPSKRTDQGPGLPIGELDKALAPFYRVEASRNRNRSSWGLGLGLSIAKDIADRHGGTLTLRNASPMGRWSPA